MLCLELGCLATTTNAVYLLVARAAAAAFRVRHIGLVCVSRLSGIQGRRKAAACASDLGGCLASCECAWGIIRPAHILRSASSTGLAVRADHHRRRHDLATKSTGDGTRSNKTSTARPKLTRRSAREQARAFHAHFHTTMFICLLSGI